MLTSYFQCIAYEEDLSYRRSTRKCRSRSFVQGFLKLHHALLGNGVASVTATDIHGVSQTVNAGAFTYYLHSLLSTAPGRGGMGMGMEGGSPTAGAGASEWSAATTNGIVVGTGTTAIAPTDYQLATAIADGTSSGQLEYLPCSGTNFTTVGSTASFDIERLFRNSSGGSIAISEVGIYCAHTDINEAISHFCIVRDLVSPAFTINNGEYARIVYTLSITA